MVNGVCIGRTSQCRSVYLTALRSARPTARFRRKGRSPVPDARAALWHWVTALVGAVVDRGARHRTAFGFLDRNKLPRNHALLHRWPSINHAVVHPGFVPSMPKGSGHIIKPNLYICCSVPEYNPYHHSVSKLIPTRNKSRNILLIQRIPFTEQSLQILLLLFRQCHVKEHDERKQRNR